MTKIRQLGRLPNFDSTTGPNVDLDLSYDGNGNLIQIDKTVGQFVYRKTLTWTDDNLTAVSEWVKL